MKLCFAGDTSFFPHVLFFSYSLQTQKLKICCISAKVQLYQELVCLPIAKKKSLLATLTSSWMSSYSFSSHSTLWRIQSTLPPSLKNFLQCIPISYFRQFPTTFQLKSFTSSYLLQKGKITKTMSLINQNLNPSWLERTSSYNIIGQGVGFMAFPSPFTILLHCTDWKAAA